MRQSKETKEDLLAKLAAANRAGMILARCYQWDREEYQSNPSLVKAVEADEVARKWIAAVRRDQQQIETVGNKRSRPAKILIN